jgi:hypothetical protein
MSARLGHGARRLIDNKFDKRNNYFDDTQILLFVASFPTRQVGKEATEYEHAIGVPELPRRYSLASSQFCLAVSSASALAGK